MQMAWEDKIDTSEYTALDGENDEIITETVVSEEMLQLGANVTLYTRAEETEDDDGNPTSTDSVDSSEAYQTRRRKNIVIEVDTGNGTESVNNTKMELKNKTRVDHNNKTAPLDAENEDYEDFPKAEPNGCNQSKKILNKLMKFFKISADLGCDDATKSRQRKRQL
ncbi:PREDICTED: uncharacterized protein LOC108561163 [Nicrophorus vespilloides]|uniref:Uncharacterized protein LOC108561163 n=1 Tax=Nicrophorus vespilloides TaxID=110193 RepID=A0ABM1MIR5_NICVS|nr:PREDICTED: uncharacterized protein LOC108561163 [Nicrophorus vespilloides]